MGCFGGLVFFFFQNGKRGGKVWVGSLVQGQQEGCSCTSTRRCKGLLRAPAQLFCQQQEASENVRLNVGGFGLFFMYRREGDSIFLFPLSAEGRELPSPELRTYLFLIGPFSFLPSVISFKFPSYFSLENGQPASVPFNTMSLSDED